MIHWSCPTVRLYDHELRGRSTQKDGILLSKRGSEWAKENLREIGERYWRKWGPKIFFPYSLFLLLCIVRGTPTTCLG